MNTPHWPNQTLKEVISFLSRQHLGGVRVAVVGERIGMTPQAVSAILHKDDTSLLWAENLARKYGYTLRIEYTLPDCIQSRGNGKVEELYPRTGNLVGLASYAISRGLTINSLAKNVNMNYRVIERALKTGNIQISTLQTILNRLGITVKWVWVPAPQSLQET